jgi:hypothetical protein
LTFARAGQTEQAQKLVESIRQRFPNDFSVQTYLLPGVRAAMKLSEKIRPVHSQYCSRSSPTISPSTTSSTMHILRTCEALPYRQLKQGRLAADQFRKVLDHSGIGAGFVTGSLSVLQLARAQVLMHDPGAARKSYEDFLTLWKDADRDIPVYRQAKAEYAELRTSLNRTD